MFKVSHKGNFNNLERLLRKSQRIDYMSILERYAEIGKQALENATPIDSGETANSWSYEVEKTKKGYAVTWHNSHMAGSTPVAILLQHGHGTRGGTFVQGVDFINPALAPVFDQLAEAVWREVTS